MLLTSSSSSHFFLCAKVVVVGVGARGCSAAGGVGEWSVEECDTCAGAGISKMDHGSVGSGVEVEVDVDVVGGREV